ncbi:HEPN domain-containing protein [Plesiomonas shigelloides]|uniref:HEPN domain-containing protein n=1 Tax=Plesiomonas shigelloides TaxID=703 RepID=UPI001C5BCD9B|nr:HEPN domain-containing protein [Plesiomonas shigelloides]MBW3794585.1 hypothetical protein [Plesiomonas shigelloides]
MYSDTDGFSKDPFGYSALAWHKWGTLATANGFPIDVTKPPTVADLKNPVLWISHAHALSTAAICLVRSSQTFESIPLDIRTICQSQYHAVALMLVGYSLEVCLKAMILIQLGVDEFTKQEKNHFHHRLDELANFIPNLSEKELAILKGLTHFVSWAGRYPDPGSQRVNNAEAIFEISEKHEICAKDLFELSAKVMNHVQTVVK